MDLVQQLVTRSSISALGGYGLRPESACARLVTDQLLVAFYPFSRIAFCSLAGGPARIGDLKVT
jgi:hypothetical protein